jgi:tRNA-dihydrouridine synthase B
MIRSHSLPLPIHPSLPLTALAPMQDVTDLAFMGIIAHYGSPDYYFTEYFRVSHHGGLDKTILRSITDNDTGRPIFAQIIGENIPDILNMVQTLKRYPIAGIDLNLGCPAPKVYRKNVGGGLLRDPERINQILGEMRSAIDGRLTVKMRIGFDHTDHFETLLELINRHRIDLLSLHGRTVQAGYSSTVDYDRIAQAVQQVQCPVLANGNITSARSAAAVLKTTGAAGVMIGRAAIRNPWIFQQIRQQLWGETVSVVTLGEVRGYIERLRQLETAATIPERSRMNLLKRYLNFVGQSVEPSGAFLQEMRQSQSEAELIGVCDRYLLRSPDAIFALEPYPGLVARPKCETVPVCR